MNKMAQDDSWRTTAFRQCVVAKIDEAIQRSGLTTSKNSMEMENHVFQKANTKEEYLGFVARLILHVQEMSSKKGGGMGGPAGNAGQPMQDPIALQNLSQQGTGNNQIMGIGVPLYRWLVPRRTPQIPANNLLQTLNQRPGQVLPDLPTLSNKMAEMTMDGSQETRDS